MGTEAGTIPIEFDELSPQEQDYYQNPPFSTHSDFLGAKGGSAQLVQPGPGRQGYQGKKPDLPTFVHNNYTGTGEINKTNPYSVYKKGEKRISFSTIEDAEKYIKEKGWVKTDPTKVRSKKVEQNIINYFDNMFNDSSKSADELLNPIKKIHEGTGHDFKVIKKALDKYPPAQDMKEIITRLSRPAFVKKIAGKGWRLDDVIAAVETKSASTRSLNPTGRIMENAARHHAQAEPGKSLIQFYDNKNDVITDLKNIDIYKDDIYFKYRDDSTKPFKAKKYGLSSSLEDVADIARTGRQEPLFKEYFSKVDELTDLKKTPVWDDLTPGLKKVFAKKGSKTTFGDVMRYAYNQGSGYSMKYFPYNIDHKSGVATKPFSDLRIISRRINQAAGHVSKWMPVGAQNYLKSMGYLFDKDMKTLVKDELTLADDILTKGRKLSSPYQIAKNKENLAQIGKKEIRRPGGGGKLYSFPGMLADKDLYKHLGKDAKKAWNIFRKVGGPWEAGIIGLDFINNLDNGMDADTAFQTALENFTMGIYKGGQRAQWEDFLQYGKELGHNQENLSEVKNIIDLQKMLKSEKESLKRLISKKGKFSEEEIGWLLKSSQQVVSRLEKELDEKRTAFWSKDNAEQIAQNYDDTVGYYARQRYNENFDKGLLDSGRKDRVNPEMGSIGSPLWESLSDWRTYLPQNLMENTSATRPVVRNLRKLPGIFGDMWDPTSEQAILSAMSEEEKAQRAKELNIQKQSYHPVTGNTMTDQQMEPYYEKFYAGGGIATLHPRRPGALPPPSGPDSQGLAYLNNYATKRTE
jgi:hypothetical protein